MRNHALLADGLDDGVYLLEADPRHRRLVAVAASVARVRGAIGQAEDVGTAGIGITFLDVHFGQRALCGRCSEEGVRSDPVTGWSELMPEPTGKLARATSGTS